MQRSLPRSIHPSQMKPSNIQGNGVMNGISKTLDGVQQVLNMVQTSAPIVQEYGPMIKNLPAMYRMIKVFKELEASDSKENAEETSNLKTKPTENEPTVSPKKVTKTTARRSSANDVPKPKLFI